MSSDMVQESVYIQQLQKLLTDLNEDAYKIVQDAGGGYLTDDSKQRLIAITAAWASIAGIYGGLTGVPNIGAARDMLKRNYSIYTWIDGSVPGFELMPDLYENGLLTGIALSELIKYAANITTIGGGETVLDARDARGNIVYGPNFRIPNSGGGKRALKGGNLREAAKHAMTLAIIVGVGAGIYQSPMATTVAVKSTDALNTARNYLIQLAYGMRVVTPGCTTPTETFWNTVLTSMAPSGALDSCAQIARKNAAELLSIRNTVIAGFNTIFTSGSVVTILSARQGARVTYNFIKDNISSPVCNTIESVTNNVAVRARQGVSTLGQGCRVASVSAVQTMKELLNRLRVRPGAAAEDLMAEEPGADAEYMAQGPGADAEDLMSGGPGLDAEYMSGGLGNGLKIDKLTPDSTPVVIAEEFENIMKKQAASKNAFMTSGGTRKWSKKYKKSINCKKPKGFSQKQYCKYSRKKRKKNTRKYR